MFYLGIDIGKFSSVATLIDEKGTIVDKSLKYKKKFDYLLPDNILNKAYEKQCLDFNGAKEFINNL